MIVRDFTNFIREQGVVGLAVGFILGGAITNVVKSLVTDLINPLLGILLGALGNLDDYYFQVGGAKVLYGSFISNIINFVIVALVVYIGVRLLKVDRLDRKKDKEEAKK